jgi:RHS repeat-associated protein
VADWRAGAAVGWGQGGNRLTNLADGDEDASVNHSYDDAGNLFRENTERHFEWDHANRLKAFRNQTGTAKPTTYALYLYGPSGDRIKKLVWLGGSYRTTVFIGTAFEHSSDVRAGQTTTNCSLHVMDDNTRVALVRIGPAFADDGAADQPTQYRLGDHQGSSTVVVGGDGMTMSREEFFPHGGSSFGGFARKRYRYVGKLRDEESGLNFHTRRCLAEWLGRWISPDPSGPVDRLNLYVYAKCSPISHSDKSGLQTPGSNEHHRVCQSCHEGEPRQDMDMRPLLDRIRDDPDVQMAAGIIMGTAAAAVPFIGAITIGVLQQQGHLQKLPQRVQAGIGIGMTATGAVQSITGLLAMGAGGGAAGGGAVLAPVTGGLSFIGSGAGLSLAAVGALEAAAGVANGGVGLYVFAQANARAPTGRHQWWLRNVRSSDLARSQRGYQVYVLKDRNGKVLYVGKSGGAGGVQPATWIDRVRAHIKDATKREWIGEVDRIDVYAGLTEQEVFAYEAHLTSANRASVWNIKNISYAEEFYERFPQGNFGANIRSAEQNAVRFSFETDIVAGTH